MEVCKKKIKDVRRIKREKKAVFNKLTPEEQKEILEKRYSPPSLAEKTNLILWDLKLLQLPFTRYKKSAETLNARLKEKPSEEEIERINSALQKMGY
jgi:hypothetical protein